MTERYRKAGATLLDTAREGAIQIRLESGKPVAVTRYRKQSARYWH